MVDPSKLHVVVIGAGPAGLMAADVVSAAGLRVTVIERMPSPARKFLMAGRGGLNLTHSEDFERFVSRYRNRTENLRPAVERFSPSDARSWSQRHGQETFVGSSGRVFPKSMKTSPLLRSWLRDLAQRGVALRTRTTWRGWNDDGLCVETIAGNETIAADATVLALGGGSWPGLGSDAAWVPILTGDGVEVRPLVASNAGVRIDWTPIFKERFAGAPLKRIALTVGAETVRGEAIITSTGLEGGAIYALSAPLRDALAAGPSANLVVDLRPDLGPEQIEQALTKRGKASLSTHLRKAVHLDASAIGLLQEVAHRRGEPLAAMSASQIAGLIKAAPLPVIGFAGIDRAISTAGGVAFDEIDGAYMLKRLPGVFVAGEMLDWDAPTGGYLLQACFATGAAAGRGVVEWLARNEKASA